MTRFVVDGKEADDPDANWETGSHIGPFALFDIELQQNIVSGFKTRLVPTILAWWFNRMQRRSASR